MMRVGIKFGIVISLVCLCIIIAALGKLNYRETGDMSVNWKTVDVLSKPFPEDALKEEDNVQITTQTLKIQGIDMFYREALIPNGVKGTGQSLLLLHGRSFKSETWKTLGTLQLMASLGHRTVAIDLPGYGNTQMTYSGDKAVFLKSVIEELSLAKPVVISPSMSGGYSVKFLEKFADSISGYVPVAPVATDSVPQNVLQKVKVPTLIVYGSDDSTGLAEKSLANLKVLPNSREIKFENAGHPAYLNQPDLWHKLLYNFLQLLQ